MTLALVVGLASADDCQIPPPFKKLTSEQADKYSIADIEAKTKLHRQFIGNATAEPATDSQARQKPVTLFNFWATWCQPCRVELPLLEKLQGINQTNIQLINIGDETADIDRVLTELDINHLTSRQAPDELLSQLALMGLPATLVWGQKPTDVFLGVGKLHDIESLDKWLTCLK